MSSAGAAAVAKGMRQQFQKNYQASMAALVKYLETEQGEKVVSQYHLLRYNAFFIPSRFLFVETDKAFYLWRYAGQFNATKHSQELRADLSKTLRVTLKKATIWDKINQPGMGDFFIIAEDTALFDQKAKYIVEAMSGFAFQDKDKQAEFMNKYQG